MNDVTIRPYRASDLERCRALWAELTEHHREIYQDPSIGGEDPGSHFDEHLAQVGPQRLWVAECQERVVGLVGLMVDEEEAEVEPLVVAASHRGRGIGRALVGRMVEEAEELGVAYLSVKPVARNLGAISFFYEAGFQKLGQIEMFTDLRPSRPGQWESGLQLFGHSFEY